MKLARAALAALALASLLAAGCPGDRPIRVGSKNFTEQVLLGEIAAQALEAAGLRVDRRLNLGGTFVCQNAIVAGELDLYPEYTGTAFTAILGEKPISDPAAVRRAVAAAYSKRWDLVWSPPLGFENNFALIVRRDDAARLGLRKISDLAGRESEIRPGFGYEFIERKDGFPGLARAYGLVLPAAPGRDGPRPPLRRAREPQGGPDRRQLDRRADRGVGRGRARGRPPLLSALRDGLRRPRAASGGSARAFGGPWRRSRARSTRTPCAG